MAKKYGKRTKSRSTKSDLSESELEAKFLNLCRSYHLRPVQQHTFHPQRQWRLDFSWPDQLLAVEIQGFGPGHNSYKGMASDYEKHNEAILLGWRFLYFMAHDLQVPNTSSTMNIVRHALGIEHNPTPQNTVLNKIESARRKLDQIANQKKGD